MIDRLSSSALLTRPLKVYWSVALCLLLAAIGCSRKPVSPVEQVEDLRTSGEFDQGVALAQQAIQAATDPLEQAQLWRLSGQCSLDKTAYVADATVKRQLLEDSLKAFDRSIELVQSHSGMVPDPSIKEPATDAPQVRDEHANTETYHLRMLTHERLHDDCLARQLAEEAKQHAELAAADGRAWRKWDRNYEAAYINEPRQRKLNLPTPDEREAAEAERAEKPSPTNQVSETRSVPDDDEESAPLPHSGSVSSRTPAGDATRAASGKPGEEATVKPRHAVEELTTVPRLPDATQQPVAEPKPADLTEETPEDEPAVPQPRSNAPHSTWPAYGPAAGNATWQSTPTSPSATTGLVGPSWPTGDPQVEASEGGIAGFVPQRAAPTTGLGESPVSTGEYPHDFVGPFGRTPTNPPPGPPRRLNSGLPPEWQPNFNGPQGNFALPYTGSMPQSGRGVAPGANAYINLPQTGPNYNPLRPSPLTNPNDPLNRNHNAFRPAATGGVVGVPPFGSFQTAPATHYYPQLLPQDDDSGVDLDPYDLNSDDSPY